MSHISSLISNNVGSTLNHCTNVSFWLLTNQPNTNQIITSYNVGCLLGLSKDFFSFEVKLMFTVVIVFDSVK